MKKFLSNFFLRGLLAAAGGPVVLAVIYGILGASGQVEALLPGEVCKGILTITILALFCGGMTAIYQVERLPLISAILLHGGALYFAYLLTYLLNGWLRSGWLPFLVFTGIFVLGYAVIWSIIYLTTKKDTENLSKKLPK